MSFNSQSLHPSKMDEPWLVLGEHSFHSRLLIGIEQYDSPMLIRQVLDAANVEALTVTYDREGSHPSLPLFKFADQHTLREYILLGTTSFARSKDEAIAMARMLRQSLDVKIIKLDVRTEDTIPDNRGVVKVAEILIAEGFYVLPFIVPDPDVAIDLEKIGCSALRLMASPVGSGQGIINMQAIQNVLGISGLPIIVEGGLRSPSDAALAMELGAAAVLVNTALAKACNPVMMGVAMKSAVEAGRLAYIAGCMERCLQTIVTKETDQPVMNYLVR